MSSSASTPTVKGKATFDDPLQYSEGIPYVAVNGELVVDEGGSPRRAPAAR